MNELNYLDLAAGDQSLVEDDFGHCEDWRDAKFLFDADGNLRGARMPVMYQASEPIKWGPPKLPDGTALDLVPGHPELSMSPAAAKAAGDETVWFDPALLTFSPMNEGREWCDDLVVSFTARGWLPEVSRALVRRLPDGTMRVVAGERRVRAARRSQMRSVPCAVVLIDDEEECELQLLENLQRKDYDLFQVASHLARLAGMGATPEELAAKTGKGVAWVYVLLRLAKFERHEAARSSGLGMGHLESIARVPSRAMRDAIVSRVLKPVASEGVMPVREMEVMMETEFFKPLNTAVFDRKDPGLVESARPCAECPQNSVNMNDGPPSGRKAWCLDPECFAAKTAAARTAWEAAQRAPGRRVMTAEEEAEVWGENARLLPGALVVRMDARPEDHELRNGVTDVPTWQEMVGDLAAEVLISKDPETGKPVVLMSKELAKTAAIENAHRIFKDAAKYESAAVTRARHSAEERKSATLEEKRAMDLRRALCEADLAAVVKASRRQKQGIPLLTMAAEMGVELVVGGAYAEEVARLMGAPAGAEEADFLAGIVTEFPEKLPGMVAALWALSGPGVFLQTPEGAAERAAVAQRLGVDLDAARARTKAEFDAAVAAADVAAATVLVWSDSRSKADDFDWQDGFCVNAATLTVVGDVVRVARSKKGWHVGIGEDLPSNGLAKYSNRKLAAAVGLKALRSTYGVATPERERIDAAIGELEGVAK